MNQMKIENMIDSKMNSSMSSSSLKRDQSDRKYGFKTNNRLQSAKTYLKESNSNSQCDVKLSYMVNIDNIH